MVVPVPLTSAKVKSVQFESALSKNHYIKSVVKRRSRVLRHGCIFIRTCPYRHKDASLFQKRPVVLGIKKWRFLARNTLFPASDKVNMILL